MSTRLSYGFAVLLLLIAAILRFTSFADLPLGLSDAEIDDVRVTETIRQGRVEVFYDLDGEGREGLYQTMLTGFTAISGAGAFDYRLPSLLIGMIGLALVYALATRLCGPLAGIAAIGLLAVNFAAIVLARTVARDAMLMPWIAAVMLALARAFFVYGERALMRADSAAFAALGVLLGFGFYLHPISLVVTLFALTFIVYRVFSARPFPRRALSFTWFSLVVVIVIAVPYFLSSIQLTPLAGTSRLADNFPGSVTALIQTVAAGVNSFLFVGDSDPTHNLPGRPLFDLISGVLMALGLLVALRGWRQSGNMLVLLAVLFLTPAALLAPVTPNFQVMSILLPLLALLFGMGFSTLYYSASRLMRVAIGAGLVVLFAFNLVWVVDDLFVEWATLPAAADAYHARLGSLARFLDRDADTPALICTPMLAPTDGDTLTDAQKLALMMHRADVPLRVADCGTTLILTDGGETQHIVLLEADGLALINPEFTRWIAAGELLSRADLPPDSVIRLTAADRLANAIGAFTTTSPVSFAPDEPGGFGVTLPPIRLEGNIAFLGYDRAWMEQVAPGDLLTVISYWRVDGVVPPDLSFFTHIQNDPAARPAAQRDTMTVLPRLLEPRDVLIQVSYIDLPFALPEGPYSVSVGAYEGGTGRRLVAFVDDAPRGTRLYLGGFTVAR
ncbi:MAG: glycosyltransferase family 39 protein [Chloroflexota bacterium]|nr:glycosyltransferase family 39 protein [Chloroflexota bacterium]